MRARALQLGLAVEADLGESLRPDDQLLLINSLGCQRLLSLDQQPLSTHALAGELLWRALID